MTESLQVDSNWFRRKFEEKGTSYRAFARAHDMDPSAVSRMLTGQRQMQRDEAAAIALFIGAPLNEVLKHAGGSTGGGLTPILLAATINELGRVERLAEPRPLPHPVIERAQSAIDAAPHVLAAQIRALTGPLTVMDDAIVLFADPGKVESAPIGALSICRNLTGDEIMAKLERARKTGEARIATIDGQVKEFDLQIATPILAIIP